MKKYFLCTITLVITGLVITSGAVSIMHSEKNTILGKQISIKKITSMDISVSVIIGPKPAIKKQIANALSRGIDVLVHHDTDENDCQNPALITDAGLSNILIFSEYYEGVGQTGMWGRYSMDNGATWSDSVVGFQAIPEDNPDDVSVPKLDYYQDSMAYGTWTAGPLNDAMIYYLELPSIVDPEFGSGWTYYYVDWTQMGYYKGFDSADVACYPYDPLHSPNEEFWGIVFVTGDIPASGPNPAEDNMVLFQYNVPGGNVALCSIIIMDEDCEKNAGEIDISLHQPYMVMEYIMEADPSDSGSMFIKTPALRPDNYPNDNWVQDLPGFTSLYLEDVYTPDITAADGSVYIVANTSEGDIVCFYSDNAGDSFQQSIVSDDSAVESFPQVTLFGDHIICTYTRDGNHYAKISEDGGVNWGTETQINDEDGTVVEQYGCTGIDGPYASWTDNRDAPPTDIYFESGIPDHWPPTITGPSTGKPGIEYDYIFNAIDPNGVDVKYIINWGDKTSDTTDFYPSGQDVTVSHAWSKQGSYIINVKAEDEFGLTSPEATKAVTIPKNKITDNPILRFFENHPSIFLILQKIIKRLGLQ